VPTWNENIIAYGWGPQKDGSVVMARCVALFATATRQMLDITVGRYDEGERALLLRSLGVLKSDDVLVLDRGYPRLSKFALYLELDIPGFWLSVSPKKACRFFLTV
jgi:hypothetical protein